MTQSAPSLGKYFAPGTSVALFGGSFDPPHEGHHQLSLAALRALGLDAVWWLVSPQNPLKTHQPQDMAQRLDACRKLARHPKIFVSDEENRLGTQYAIDTVRQLKARHHGVHFVWLMGSDSLASLHRWKQWQELVQEIPLVIYPRPGTTLKALSSKAAQRFQAHRIDPAQAASFKNLSAPAWMILSGKHSDLSSSALRQNEGALKHQ